MSSSLPSPSIASAGYDVRATAPAGEASVQRGTAIEVDNERPDGIGGVIEVTGGAASVSERDVRRKYELVTRALIENGLTITTMESCTSGQVASLITDTEGSSAAIKGAFVTYSNDAKVMQGVPEETIELHGVYSAETAAAMAEACRHAYGADIGVGITGSFGNADPNNEDSIPGEVYFSIAQHGETKCFHCSVPVQESRFMYKLYMADVIATQLPHQGFHTSVKSSETLGILLSQSI